MIKKTILLFVLVLVLQTQTYARESFKSVRLTVSKGNTRTWAAKVFLKTRFKDIQDIEIVPRDRTPGTVEVKLFDKGSQKKFSLKGVKSGYVTVYLKCQSWNFLLKQYTPHTCKLRIEVTGPRDPAPVRARIQQKKFAYSEKVPVRENSTNNPSVIAGLENWEGDWGTKRGDCTIVVQGRQLVVRLDKGSLIPRRGGDIEVISYSPTEIKGKWWVSTPQIDGEFTWTLQPNNNEIKGTFNETVGAQQSRSWNGSKTGHASPKIVEDILQNELAEAKASVSLEVNVDVNGAIKLRITEDYFAGEKRFSEEVQAKVKKDYESILSQLKTWRGQLTGAQKKDIKEGKNVSLEIIFAKPLELMKPGKSISIEIQPGDL